MSMFFDEVGSGLSGALSSLEVGLEAVGEAAANAKRRASMVVETPPEIPIPVSESTWDLLPAVPSLDFGAVFGGEEIVDAEAVATAAALAARAEELAAQAKAAAEEVERKKNLPAPPLAKKASFRPTTPTAKPRSFRMSSLERTSSLEDGTAGGAAASTPASPASPAATASTDTLQRTSRLSSSSSFSPSPAAQATLTTPKLTPAEEKAKAKKAAAAAARQSLEIKLASDEAIARLTYAQKLSRSSAAGRMQAFSGPGERALITAGWNQVHAVMYDLEGLSANPASFFEQFIGHARSAIDENAFQDALRELDLALSPDEAKMVWLTATADGESVTAPSYASAAKRYPMTDKYKNEYLDQREAEKEAEKKALALEKEAAAEKAAAEKAAAEAREEEARRAQAEKDAQLAAAASAESQTLDDVYEAFSQSLGGFSTALGSATGSGSSSSSSSSSNQKTKKKKKAPAPAAAPIVMEEEPPKVEEDDLPTSPKTPIVKPMAPAFVSKILTKAQKELAGQGWLSIYLLMEARQEQRRVEEDEDGRFPLFFSDDPGAFFLVCLMGLSEEERLAETENALDAPPRYLDKASFDKAISKLDAFQWASDDEAAIVWRTMIDHNATAGRGGHTCASMSSFTGGARKFKPSPKAFAKAKKIAAASSSSSSSSSSTIDEATATTAPENDEGQGESASSLPLGDATGDNSSSNGNGDADGDADSSSSSSGGSANIESSSSSTNAATNSKNTDGKSTDSTSIRVGTSGAKISLSDEERVLAQAGWDAIHEACDRLSNGDAAKFFDVHLGAAANGGALSQAAFENATFQVGLSLSDDEAELVWLIASGGADGAITGRAFAIAAKKFPKSSQRVKSASTSRPASRAGSLTRSGGK